MTTITLEKAIVHRALSALEYHTQQTRPIHNTELVIEELRAVLAAPATAPERKPMTDEQIETMWPSPEGTNSIHALIRAVEAFHGIKEDKP